MRKLLSNETLDLGPPALGMAGKSSPNLIICFMMSSELRPDDPVSTFYIPRVVQFIIFRAYLYIPHLVSSDQNGLSQT